MRLQGRAMSFGQIFVLALLSGAVVQFAFKSVIAAAVLPVLCYAAWSVHHEFFVPYQGGGASFWPLDIVFVGSVAGTGGGIGALLMKKLFGKSS
jgi:hypothetical protein